MPCGAPPPPQPWAGRRRDGQGAAAGGPSGGQEDRLRQRGGQGPPHRLIARGGIRCVLPVTKRWQGGGFGLLYGRQYSSVKGDATAVVVSGPHHSWTDSCHRGNPKFSLRGHPKLFCRLGPSDDGCDCQWVGTILPPNHCLTLRTLQGFLFFISKLHLVVQISFACSTVSHLFWEPYLPLLARLLSL